MENTNIKINLAAFIHTTLKVKGKAGNEVEGIFIPFEKNNIFKGTKGHYVDLIAFPIKNKSNDSRDTHLIKQSFSKEKRESMTKEQQDNLPIIGNMIDWNYVTQATSDPDLQGNQVVTPETGKDDLPF